MWSGHTPCDGMAGAESMGELAHIRLGAVKGFLIDNLGQLMLRQLQWPALFRHELILREPTLANPTIRILGGCQCTKVRREEDVCRADEIMRSDFRWLPA